MALLKTVDPDGLLEYSVVFTDRSLNHMSEKFQTVMRDISAILKNVYEADAVAIIPGGGTAAMEAVARQLAKDKHVMTLRNGFFNYRWSQIFEKAHLIAQETVLKAQRIDDSHQAAFRPHECADVIEAIDKEKPDMVFATHVETASGILLPNDYIKALADAIHSRGGLLVLDAIASGALWPKMKALGVDILITAPQKGWTASPGAGIVLMNEKAKDAVLNTQSDSFMLDLKKWLGIMEAYENGEHAYHSTLPTDTLTVFRDVLQEAAFLGFPYLEEKQWILGQKIRAILAEHGFKSVAARTYEAPSVVVSYTDDVEIQTGRRFRRQGIQIAAGVPLMCDEPIDFLSFRIGLLGLDKLCHIDRTVDYLSLALKKLDPYN